MPRDPPASAIMLCSMTLDQTSHTTVLEDESQNLQRGTGKGSRKRKGKAKVKFSPTESKSFPQFSRPPEKIQRRIFEHSICHDTSISPALALDSRKVNGWQVNGSVNPSPNLS